MKNKSQLSPLLHGIKTLMYHRIDVSETDPWSICVSIKFFEEQIKFLKNNFNIISSDDLIEQVTTNNIIKNSICITFDDGYADNYINAKPILEKYNCPATFFISTAFINSTKHFWWDELEIILLHSIELPGRLLLEFNGEIHSYIFDENKLTEKQLVQHAHWKWYETPPTDRCEMFLKIWGKLRLLINDDIEMHINVLRMWAGAKNITNSRIPMNDHQLIELSKNPLFTIGMHTHTHPDLKGKHMAFQLEEITICKKTLNTKYRVDSNCLAYPYGRYDDDTIKAVKKLKVKACFTTCATDMYVYLDMTIIGRCQMFDEGSASLQKLLKS